MIRPTHAQIDLAALRANIGVLRSQLERGTRIMGIAKADCYGHSAGLCIPEMIAAGIDIFGVATAQEAIELRALGVTQPVVVLPPPLDGEYGLFAEAGLESVVSNMAMSTALDAAAAALGRRLNVHLFVNTGMGRNGVSPAEAVDLLHATSALPNLDVVGIASHFATSDEPEDPFTAAQCATFDATLREAHDAGFSFRDIHIANSGGVLNFRASHYNLVRPGLALYGYHPTAERQAASGLRPVMRLRTIVSNITPMPAGASVSYSRRYRTQNDTLIASLPIGYADGLMRILTNNADVLIAGRRYPIVGTICMDEVLVDLGPGSSITAGAEAVLIGTSAAAEIDAWEVAGRAATIPYEICTNVSRRVPRAAMMESPSAGGAPALDDASTLHREAPVVPPPPHT